MKVDAVELRRRKKDAMPRVDLSPIHTQFCRVLPDRKVLIAQLPQNGVVAEVGVAFGDFTKVINQVAKPKKLHLVDAWEGERYSPGLKKVKSIFKDQIAKDAVIIHQGISVDMLKTLPDRTFDWMYIDTNHSYQTTYDELVLASDKVVANGILAGHDFCTGNVVGAVPYGVIEACNKFCVDMGWTYRFLTLESHGHFSFALSKIP